MIKNPTLPTLDNAKLLDSALSEINTKLSAGLSWLDNTYTKSTRLKKKKDGRPYVYPAVYAGNNEYLDLLPDSHKGNYCFWEIDDPANYTEFDGDLAQVRTNFSLIFWFDFRDVYATDHETRTIENVKADILKVLREMGVSSSFFISSVAEQVDNVFAGYTTSPETDPYYMRPYGMLRFEGEIYARESCSAPATSVNLLLMVGPMQSNGDGRGTPADATGTYAMTNSRTHIWQITLNDGVAGTGNDDQDKDNLNLSSGAWATMNVANNTNCQPNAKKQDNEYYGLEVSLAESLTTYTNRDTYVIKAAWSGTTITAHRPPPNSGVHELHEILEDYYISPAMTALRALGVTIIPYPFICFQGESDVGDQTRSENWHTYTKGKLNDLRAFDTAFANLPEVVCRIYATATGYADATYYPTTRERQGRFVFINTDAQALGGDGLHFTGPGQEGIGVLVYNEIKDYPTDTAAPTFSSAVVENATPTKLRIRHSKALKDTITPDPGSWTLTGDASGLTVTAVDEITGPTVELTLSGAVQGGWTFGVSYTEPGTNPLQRWKGQKVASYTGQSVTNNVTTGPQDITLQDIAGTLGTDYSVGTGNDFEKLSSNGWNVGARSTQTWTGDATIYYEINENIVGEATTSPHTQIGFVPSTNSGSVTGNDNRDGSYHTSAINRELLDDSTGDGWGSGYTVGTKFRIRRVVSSGDIILEKWDGAAWGNSTTVTTGVTGEVRMSFRMHGQGCSIMNLQYE